MGAGDAMETVAKELPNCPTVEVGLNVTAVGGCCGVNVSFAREVTPIHDAVRFAVVFALTMLVGIAMDAEGLPGATLTTAGGCTTPESLVRLTAAPAAGA